MHLIRLAGFLVLFLPTLVLAESDEKEIPDYFDSVSTNSVDAYVFAKKCFPSVTEPSFQKMIQDAGSNASVTTRSSDRYKSFLVVNKARTICVSISNKQYPILPLEIFDGTVSFNEMSPEIKKILRTSLAHQLAQTGTANALVRNELGNAWAIYYLFASDTPSRVYYHADFLKAGEFDENKFAFSTSAPGTVSVSARGLSGQMSENVKYLFQK